jgi:hypothetical protein
MAFEEEMAAWQTGNQRTPYDIHVGKEVVRKYYDSLRAIKYIQSAFETLFWYRADAVVWREKYVELCERYRQYMPVEMRLRRAGPELHVSGSRFLSPLHR